jgi:MoaA/NifB/PqqE/SkfB family radical SAM enzyme
MDAGLDYISFSFDGYEKASYEAARAGGKYEKTLGNILQFLRLKQERGARKPYAVLQVMELDDDPKPLRRRKRREFLAQFRGLPLNRVTIRTPHNWGGNIAFPGAEWHAGKRYAPCPFPWYSMTVLWSGKVCPCPQDFMGALEMGDLNQSSLEEVWNGPGLRTLRQRLRRRDIPAHWPCASCDRLYRKRILGIPTDYLAPFLRDNLGLASLQLSALGSRLSARGRAKAGTDVLS